MSTTYAEVGPRVPSRRWPLLKRVLSWQGMHVGQEWFLRYLLIAAAVQRVLSKPCAVTGLLQHQHLKSLIFPSSKHPHHPLLGGKRIKRATVVPVGKKKKITWMRKTIYVGWFKDFIFQNFHPFLPSIHVPILAWNSTVWESFLRLNLSPQ